MALTRVNGNLISSGTITGNLFGGATITGDKIGLAAITSNLIASAAVTGDKIASATIGSSNLTSTGVTAGIYGGTGNTVNITVDAQGRVTAAANVASAGASAATPTALGTVYGITPAGTAAVALGYQAAATTTSAVGVTAIGYQALNVNSATHNTAVGHQALVSNTTGSENMAIGTSALGGVTTGSENIGIGRGAGASAVSSSRNIYIGDDAGYLMSGNNNTILGRFTGNQGGLNILSSSNYIVLSDGDGNPLISTSNTRSVALSGAVPQTGTGITFPATQSASSDANTLDDYEEGTWTPTGFSAGYTASTAAGTYTKIGRVVYCKFNITFSAVNGSANATTAFSGLPFTSTAVSTPGVARDDSTTGAIYVVYIGGNTSAGGINAYSGIANGSARTLAINENYICSLTYHTS